MLHPIAGIETAYDSNLYSNDTDENPQGVPFLRFGGQLDLATAGGGGQGPSAARRVDFQLSAGGGFRNFLSDNEGITSQNSADLRGNLGLTLNPGGAISFGLRDNYQRVPEAPPYEFGEPLTRNVNSGGPFLTLRPGGRALSIDTAYTYNFDLYEEKPSSTSGLDPGKTWHMVTLGARWQNLPLTAVTVDGDYSLINHDDPSEQLVDSTHWRGYLGVTTVLTPSVTLVVAPGYGQADYDARPADSLTPGADVDFAGVIGRASIGWKAGHARIGLGYDRNFGDGSNSNFYVDDYVYLRYQHRLGLRIHFDASGGLRLRKYDGLIGDSGGAMDPSREDTLGEGQAQLAFQLSNWLYFIPAYFGSANFSAHDVGAPGATTTDSTKFVKHIALVRLEASY